MTLLEGVALYQELGRALAPVPALRLRAVLCGRGAGPGRQRGAEGVGGCRTSPRARPCSPRRGSSPGGAFSPLGVQLRAEASTGGFTLSGTKRHVAFAKAADRLVVLARTGDGPADVDLFLVDPSTDGRVPDPAVLHRLGHPVRRGRSTSVARRRSRADRRRGDGLGHLVRGAPARAGPPGRPGHRRRPPGARHHGPVRQGPPASSTSRSGPSRPSPTTWPTR